MTRYKARGEDWLVQLAACRQMAHDMLRDIERKGFVWRAERGCYVHPNGDEVWIE